mmetsp:Transcript_22217/g.57215  ORF Transcript_22217/g.57215 Transcript_22217/m.57215 type:complete len:86 (-) Transcript_22217:41-298(-)
MNFTFASLHTPSPFAPLPNPVLLLSSPIFRIRPVHNLLSTTYAGVYVCTVLYLLPYITLPAAIPYYLLPTTCVAMLGTRYEGNGV